MTSISYTFTGSSNLKSVSIPNSVTSIGDEAFSGCSSLTSITLVDGVVPIKIASNAFQYVKPTSLYWGRSWDLNIDYSQVTDLTIGNCLKNIPASKFKNHTKIKKLKLGSSITSIGDEAFSGCTALEEVVLPPAVESIGASAFAGNRSLRYIIMGSKVKTIGEKAFDGCPASTVSITTPEPPKAPNNTFSNYTGKLYCVDKAAADAYYDAFTCWDRFDSYVMVTPSRLEGEQTEIKGVAGEQIQLTATLWPENVTLPQVFWRTTNPEVATVDANGLVTLHVDINRSRGIQ
ncbi:MAG: leucine-rich repeat protein, partial [Duncaniella sp.]|nr:leucine-rich repeat protein [Duncaniella sp.]